MTVTQGFEDFDVAGFLREFWQQKPLLIRNPWADWTNPLSPDELAGLAMEDHVEARLITRGEDSWQAEHGPIPERRFGALGRDPWTLLVQAVDQNVPEVSALIEPFRFIPDWRIDDVMVSYANDGGGVGAHFDHYDVFLIQGLGRRRWQIGGHCDQSTALLPHDHLRLLANFEPVEEWVLEPGDILYVPPGVAHNGVAVGDDCMTYSVGFRAPSRSELISGWCDDQLAAMQDDDRYSDPMLAQQENPGEISAEAIDRLHGMITAQLQDRDAFARWFGEFNSTPKYPEIDWQPDEQIDAAQLRSLSSEGASFYRNSASRFSYVRDSGDTVILFVDGESYECAGEAAELAEQICAQTRIHVESGAMISDTMLELLVSLINQGSMAIDD